MILWSVTIHEPIISVRLSTHSIRQSDGCFVIQSVSQSIGDFRVDFSFYFKASLRAKSFLRVSVFIHIEVELITVTKKFALRLALKERLRGIRKWPIGLCENQLLNLVTQQVIMRWISLSIKRPASQWVSLFSFDRAINTCEVMYRLFFIP